MNRSTRILLYGMFLVAGGLLLHVFWGTQEDFECTARLCVLAGVLIGAHGAFNHDQP
jgi:hypothetical protein